MNWFFLTSRRLCRDHCRHQRALETQFLVRRPARLLAARFPPLLRLDLPRDEASTTHHTLHSRLTPILRASNAVTKKQAAVTTAATASESQKPIRGSVAGKIRNIGSVGSTYQKV